MNISLEIIDCVDYSPIGKLIAAVSNDHTKVKLLNFESGECLKQLEGHKVRTFCFSPDCLECLDR